MIEIAVTANLECAHKDSMGRIHGHSYLIEGWFHQGRDLVALHEEFRSAAASVDHSLLEDSVGGPRMEDIAAWFLHKLPEANRIVVRRPTLGFIVEARR